MKNEEGAAELNSISFTSFAAAAKSLFFILGCGGKSKDDDFDFFSKPHYHSILSALLNSQEEE